VKKPKVKTFFIGELGLNLVRAVGNCPQEDCYAYAAHSTRRALLSQASTFGTGPSDFGLAKNGLVSQKGGRGASAWRKGS
jgi:hypothetical protein